MPHRVSGREPGARSERRCRGRTGERPKRRVGWAWSRPLPLSRNVVPASGVGFKRHGGHPISGNWRQPPTPPPRRLQPADPCNNVPAGRAHGAGSWALAGRPGRTAGRGRGKRGGWTIHPLARGPTAPEFGRRRANGLMARAFPPPPLPSPTDSRVTSPPPDARTPRLHMMTSFLEQSFCCG
jgi:hypothetical protein